MKHRGGLWGTAIVLLLAACSRPPGTEIPPQYWQEIRIGVETRPTPVRPGMNEIWVICNDQKRRPVSDLLVELSVSGSDREPVQAIQDGLSGVYRRAIYIRDPRTQQLRIHLRRGEQTGTVSFSLVPTPGAEDLAPAR